MMMVVVAVVMLVRMVLIDELEDNLSKIFFHLNRVSTLSVSFLVLSVKFST